MHMIAKLERALEIEKLADIVPEKKRHDEIQKLLGEVISEMKSSMAKKENDNSIGLQSFKGKCNICGKPFVTAVHCHVTDSYEDIFVGYMCMSCGEVRFYKYKNPELAVSLKGMCKG